MHVKNPEPRPGEIHPFESWAELDAIADELSAASGALVIFLAVTGVRPEEGFGAEWRDVDLDRHMLMVRRAYAQDRLKEYDKTAGSRRAVPLRARVVDALERLPQRRGVVFPAAEGGRVNINNWRNREWTPALAAADVQHRRIYDLRHTYATWSLAAGVDIFTLARRMGTSVKMIDRTYGHLVAGADVYERDLLDAFDRAKYLRLYTEAGARYGIDPWILAAIGWIETQHGRSTAPGVRSGVNAYGCCAGPMQFNIRNGSPSTLDSFRADGNHDGRRSPYDPSDAIPAAAKYPRATGAPGDYRTALFAYNHAEWYVAQVLTKAAAYRGAPRAGGDLAIDPATVRELLGNPRIVLTPVQRADLQAGGIDPRLIATLAAIGRRHTVVITALQSDHQPGTNHEAGRAMDIGTVDGEPCNGQRTGACAQLVREPAAVEGPLSSTELIYCWDPDGPADPRGFARADHCDHIHWGLDG